MDYVTLTSGHLELHVLINLLVQLGCIIYSGCPTSMLLRSDAMKYFLTTCFQIQDHTSNNSCLSKCTSHDLNLVTRISNFCSSNLLVINKFPSAFRLCELFSRAVDIILAVLLASYVSLIVM